MKPITKQYRINTRAVGYKSIDAITINVRYFLSEEPRQLWADLFGDTATVVNWLTFDVDGKDIKEGLVKEWKDFGGGRSDLDHHLKQLVREVILFGIHYQGYQIVTERTDG